MDLDLDPTPDPDPTPVFSDFKDEKIYFFSIVFFYNLPSGILPYLQYYISGSKPLTNGSGSGEPQKHADPTDPDPSQDPRHW
jgi:hypothetical protein